MKIVSRDLRTLFSVGAVGLLSDGQLLGRFAARREEAAFEALVRRHGPMVWGVCRRILRNPHDAEDAFQATFLVLARKAASIAQREMVANWQGQRSLKCCAGEDFQQEVLVPPTTAAFHGDTVAAGMLLQE